MAMSLGEAHAVLQEAKREAEAAAVLSAALQEHFNQVASRLQSVAGSGITPERMPSTLGLAREAHKIAEEQHQRAFRLFQGIMEIIS
jgi:DNA polymerase III delta subunit